MPPPSLSTTTIVRSTPRPASPSKPFVSCRNAMSPISSAVGRPEPRATPTAVDTTPSMPLAPRLAITRTPVRGRAYHSTSRTGMDDDTTSELPAGSGGDDVAGHLGLGRLGVGVERRRDGRLRPGFGPRPAGRPRGAAGAPEAAGEGGAQRGGIGRHHQGGGVLRVGPGAGRVDLHLARPGAGEPLGRAPPTPAGARAAARPSACGRPRTPDGRGGRGRRRRSRRRACGSPERASASTGQPVARARAWTAAGSPAPCPADDDAPLLVEGGDEDVELRVASAPAGPAAAGARARRRADPPATGPDSPTSGSRNGRFRWTGPGPDARSPRPPPGRRAIATWRRSSSSGTPGSWNQRTAVPKSLSWSMVCGAPTSRSSGGRSAVQHEHRHLGLVGLDDRRVQLGGGRAAGAQHRRGAARGQAEPEGRGRRPSARRGGRAAAGAGSAASASASGVDREPGATTASVTPARTHSSTSVAQNVAAAVTGTLPILARWGCTSSAGERGRGGSCSSTASPRPAARGPRSPPTWPPTTRSLLVDAPGHGGSAAVRADLARGAELLVEAGGPGVYVGYSMGGRLALHAALAAPSSVVGARARRRHGRHRGPRRAGRAAGGRRGAGGVDRARRRRRVPRPLAGRPAVRRAGPRGGAGARSAWRNTAAGLAASLRLAGTGRPGAALGPARRACDAGARAGRRARRQVRRARPSGWPRPSRDATFAVVPGAGHAAHLEQPDAFLAVLRPWLGRLETR